MEEILNKIDEMKVKASRLIVKEPHDKLDEIVNDISEGYIVACDEIKEIIQSEQKINGWIPISPETNPKKSDIYLVTFDEGGKRYVERFYYSDLIGWMMPVIWQDEGHIDNLIAWQPLPESYKEEEK